MDSENYWKVFQSTGDIEYYLQYKQSAQAAKAQPKEKQDADDDDGVGVAGD